MKTRQYGSPTALIHRRPGLVRFISFSSRFPFRLSGEKREGGKEGRKEGRIPGIWGPRGVEIAPSVRSGVSSGGGIVRIRGTEGFLFFFLLYLFVRLFIFFFFPISESNELRITRERREIRGDGICKGEKVSFDDSLFLSFSLSFFQTIAEK